MSAIKIPLKDLEYERLKAVLTELKDLAQTVEDYENSVYADYRNMAESYNREIIDILLELEI